MHLYHKVHPKFCCWCYDSAPCWALRHRFGLMETICVQIRVWARKKAIESGHGDYALEKTGPILAFFEDYYNSSYPLSKSG